MFGRPRGQAIVETALVMPLLLFTALGFIEAAMLIGQQAEQARAAAVVADHAAKHDDSSWNDVVNQVGLGGCEVEVTDEPHDIVKVGVTCVYEPRVTRGLWDGLPISVEAFASRDTKEPNPTPSPTPEPSPSEVLP